MTHSAAPVPATAQHEAARAALLALRAEIAKAVVGQDAVVSGLVLGVAGSKEFKRGLLRGALNSALLLGGMAALIFLVQLATDPTIL